MLLIFLFLLAVVNGSSPLSPDLISALDSQIQKVVQCHGLSGLSLTVVRDGETLFHSGYGHSDIISRSPVTPDTLYAIGSVSKQFTSFLLEYYQEQGMIDLVQPLAPQLAGANEIFRITAGSENDKINVKDLLSHRTGLPNYMGLEFLGNSTRQQLFQDLFYTEQDSRREYRGSWHYNNWLYVAAARAGEIMSGRTYEQDLQSLVYNNLGMRAGTLSDEGFVGRNKGRIAKPYLYLRGENRFLGDEVWLRSWNPSMTPAGGLLASGKDMALWMNFLLGGGVLNSRRRLVRSQTIDNMFHKLSEYKNWSRPFPNWSSSCVGYGEGWFLFTCPLDHDNPEYSHSGNYYNVHYSKINLYPEHKLGVFYAFSGGQASLNRKLFSVLDVIILDMVLNGNLDPDISAEVDRELESWGCQSNDFPVLQDRQSQHQGRQSQHQSIGGVSHQDDLNQLPSDSNIKLMKLQSPMDVRPRLTSAHLGVFRHPFLGKAELLYDHKHTPRLVLNDRWTSRVYEVKANHSEHSGRKRKIETSEEMLVLHCFFDNIPWLPDHLKDDAKNEMVIEIEPPASPHSKVQKITIKRWISYDMDAVSFTRVKD